MLSCFPKIHKNGGEIMPKKPKKPCACPGCPNLTDDTYCDKHKGMMSKRYERYSRDKHHGENYGKAWRKIRRAYVESHPLCEKCLEEGRYVKVEEVHHIVPVSEGGTNDADNLMSLCRNCHAKIHAEMGTRNHNKKVYEMDDSFRRKK